ncbi:hypothetical protein NT90_08680 [Acinetobacter baumannii]|nr:hypothetical protein NT90_08680 [Acinetobacter baumannii]
MSRNDLKPKTLKAIKLFKDDLSGVVIAFGIESQEIMNVQSQLLLLGVLPDIKIMVAERKRVDRLVGLQHTRMCPSPVLPLREGTRSTHRSIPQKGINLMRS